MKRKAGRPEAECGDSIQKIIELRSSVRIVNVIIPVQIFRHILCDGVSRI